MELPIPPNRWDLGRDYALDDILSFCKVTPSEVDEGGGIDKFMLKGVAAISSARKGDLSFLSSDSEAAIDMLSRSKGVVLCPATLKGKVQAREDSSFIFVDDPRKSFVAFLDRATKDPLYAKIQASDSVVIGSRCKIGQNAVIGNNCVIGDDCTIKAGAILENCIIGNNCVIHPGTTVGSDGFAYERRTGDDNSDDLGLIKFPHFGMVVIKDNVEICAGCSVTRGSLTHTVIGHGTKLDALVHVAHNVQLGENCQLAAGTIIGGSARIGNNCWLGLNCTINDHVQLGNGVLVASGAVVTKNFGDDVVLAGAPAESKPNSKILSRKKDLFNMTGRRMT